MSRLLLGKEPLSMVRDSRDHLRLVITKPLEGGGGGTAIYGLYRYVPCEGYGFQAVYSRIGYMNQSVWV